MMLYILDTDMLTLVQEGHAAAGKRFLEHEAKGRCHRPQRRRTIIGMVYSAPKSEICRAIGLGLWPVDKQRSVSFETPDSDVR